MIATNGGDDELDVSIHAPAWGATSGGGGVRAGEGVSIHAPAWGATIAPLAFTSTLQCFNSRSRVGSDIDKIWRGQNTIDVSIHAPAWGATSTLIIQRPTILQVSIHAPAWGATSGLRQIRTQRVCFNSRSRVGSDSWMN